MINKSKTKNKHSLLTCILTSILNFNDLLKVMRNLVKREAFSLQEIKHFDSNKSSIVNLFEKFQNISLFTTKIIKIKLFSFLVKFDIFFYSLIFLNTQN